MHSQSVMKKETIGQYNAATAMYLDYIAGVQIARGMLTGTPLFTLMLRIAPKKVHFSRIFGLNFSGMVILIIFTRAQTILACSIAHCVFNFYEEFNKIVKSEFELSPS